MKGESAEAKHRFQKEDGVVLKTEILPTVLQSSVTDRTTKFSLGTDKTRSISSVEREKRNNVLRVHVLQTLSLTSPRFTNPRFTSPPLTNPVHSSPFHDFFQPTSHCLDLKSKWREA